MGSFVPGGVAEQKYAAESKAEGKDRIDLVFFSIIQVSSHVVFVFVVVDDDSLPVVSQGLLSDCLVECGCLFREVSDSWRNRNSGGGVGTMRPVVLVAQVSHTNFVIKIVLTARVSEVYVLQNLLVLQLNVNCVPELLLLLILELFLLFFIFLSKL